MGRAPSITHSDLRRFAVARSLFGPTTLKRALEQFGFVQADPIRAPARAQDLTLRHRVREYRASASATALKAVFHEPFVFSEPVVPSPTGLAIIPYTGTDRLTVGGELNKLAWNIAVGRNMAGIHWRSDGLAGLKLGEEVALSVMRDMRDCFNELFRGFSLTKFDGTTVAV